MRTITTKHGAAGILAAALAAPGCAPAGYDPNLATRPYPESLHSTEVEDMHVFRDGTMIEIVNSTPRSYHDFDLWLNQRYVAPVRSLSAGATIRLSLWRFYDQWGEPFNAGGFWRVREPTPVHLVEIQPAEGEPMIGLVMIHRQDSS